MQKKLKLSILSILIISTVILFSVSVFATKNQSGSKIFHESNNSLEIFDDIKGDFNIQQLDLNTYPIICSNLLTCKQENFIIIPLDKNYNFKSDDLGIRTELHNGKNNIDSVEYYLLQNISSQVENYVLTWNNISSSVPDSRTGNTTNITIWNNISTYSPDSTYRTEYNTIWTKLNDNNKIRGKSGNITIALVFRKKAELDSFAIKTIPSFFGYEEENMTWWNTSYAFMYNNPLVNISHPYVFSLNISNNTNAFGNTTHLNISCYQANCTDMVFTRDNATVEPYWFETNTSNSDYAVAYFNTTANATAFQLYTGATGVPDNSNKYATFSLFDDFNAASVNTTTWTVTGTPSQNGSGFVKIPAVTNQGLISKTIYNNNVLMKSRVRINTYDTYGFFGLKTYTNIQENWDNAMTYVINNVASRKLAIGGGATAFLYTYGTMGVGWNNYTIAQTNSTNWMTSVNDSGIQYFTTTVGANQLVHLESSTTNAAADFDVDYVFVRPYIYPEPVWATWGSANQQSTSSYIPPTPTNLSNRTGSFWINYTWDAGTGNITNSYNISQNNTWTNGTTVNFSNASVGTHGWSNISVWAYNTSAGTLSTTSLNNNTRVPNNVPVQQSIGNKTIDEGKWLNFSISSTDADSDSLTYATNATKGTLLGNNFNWSITYSDSGTYIWYFSTSDAYGGVANETIVMTITNIPLTINTTSPSSDPTTVQDISQTFTAGTNRSANFVWTINGTIVQTDNNVNSSSYVNSTAGYNSSYNITVNATDEVDTVFKIWNWTVMPQSSTSTSYVPGGFSGGSVLTYTTTPPQQTTSSQIGIKIVLNGLDARIEIPDTDIFKDIPVKALNLYFNSRYHGEYKIITAKYTSYSPPLESVKQYFSIGSQPDIQLKDTSSIDIFSPAPVDIYQLYQNGWQKNPVYKISNNIYRIQISSIGIFAVKDKGVVVKDDNELYNNVNFIESLKELIIQKDWKLYNKISSIIAAKTTFIQRISLLKIDISRNKTDLYHRSI